VRKHSAKYPQLCDRARELAKESDAAKRAYHSAQLAATQAADIARAAQETFAHHRAELKQIVRAGAQWLQSQGLDSAAAVEERFARERS
jgi:hypothetical protein